MLNAIVLAGDNARDNGSKAFIKIKDRYMIEYIIDSLRYSKYINRIVAVGPKGLLDDCLGQRIDGAVECRDSIIKNVRAGIDYLNENSHVLVCTSDIPMVTSRAIDDFTEQCIARNVDVGYPIIEKSLNDTKYPDVKRTYVKMRDGTYTGGNILYINPSVISSCYDMAEELVKNRKNAIKMGRVLGIPVLAELTMGILSIETVENRVNKMFGINARAIKTLYPEIGNDVDKACDVDFVNKYIGLGA